MAAMMAQYQPTPGGGVHPAMPQGHPMAGTPGPHMGQPMMHPGVTGAPHVSQAGAMMGMQAGPNGIVQAGMGPQHPGAVMGLPNQMGGHAMPGGMAHGQAMSHLTPQQLVQIQHAQQLAAQQMHQNGGNPALALQQQAQQHQQQQQQQMRIRQQMMQAAQAGGMTGLAGVPQGGLNMQQQQMMAMRQSQLAAQQQQQIAAQREQQAAQQQAQQNQQAQQAQQQAAQQAQQQSAQQAQQQAHHQATDEIAGHLPTSYCTILYNDELVYRTRSKAVSSKPIFNAGTERFIRDWRSAIITVTVRDQRNRQHDPILGVVPLKLSDVLETSSQVTRWYPLDGGIGFGRIRISLLFRSIETRLPPAQLGWDVGTFTFASPQITATGYNHHARIKLRTGGSVGKISRSVCHALEGEQSGYSWDLTKALDDDGKPLRLPVKYRYRSPIVFELHVANKRKADAYAILWLHELVDNEETDQDIAIYQTACPARLTQNFLTPEVIAAGGLPGLEDLKEIGRLQFKGLFKAGMDESHEAFIVDNDSRETFETWEACLAEGVRTQHVEKELPERVQTLHDESLLEGRDVLKGATEEEKIKWLSKTGTDWSGAFGEDPASYVDSKGKKRREPGAENPRAGDDDDEDDDDDDDDDDESDLGIVDGENDGRKSIGTMESGWTAGTSDSARSEARINRQNKKTEERKQRGIMQWKPARNLKFAKDEGMIGLRKIKHKITGGLDGRQPGVETETAT